MSVLNNFMYLHPYYYLFSMFAQCNNKVYLWSYTNQTSTQHKTAQYCNNNSCKIGNDSWTRRRKKL